MADNNAGTCSGPLIWHDVDPRPDLGQEAGAVLECGCGYMVTTGNLLDERHANTPVLRGGFGSG